jgi:hypothetical protein
MGRCGPQQWERLRILQACERLEVPVKLWPKFKFPELPEKQKVNFRVEDRPDLPPYRPLEESISEWKNRCREHFDKFLDEQARLLDKKFQDAVKLGLYTKIAATRETTALNLRYEWTAQRMCYRTPYHRMAKAGYSADRIKQSVLQILKKAGIQERI